MNALIVKFLLLSLLSLACAAHACTLPKSYYKHVSCTSRSGVFLAVKDNGSPVALLNKKGEKTADLFAYQAVLGSEFRDGLLPALKNGKVGYINDKGKTVIGFHYDRLNGKAWARGVRGGRIVVKQNGGFGVLDTRGKVIIKPNKAHQNITDFSQGVAKVTSSSGSYTIDKHGNKHKSTPLATPTHELPPSHEEMTSSHEEMASQSLPIPPNSHTPLIPKQQDGKWGFVDDQEVPMIIFTFDEVRPYSEGLAAVRMGDNWGFINEGGQLVIDFRFHKDGFILDSPKSPELSEPLVFRQGRVWIGNLNNGDKLCVNTQGVNIIC